MPSAADTLIARLQADCTAAEAAERAVRTSVEAQLKDAERARTFAWRRLSALSDMARIAVLEPDRAIAVERQLVALFREIGWVETGLDELGEGARPLLDWLRPIAEALHVEAHPVEAEIAGESAEPPPVTDPVAAFRAFEAWYEAERGQPFLEVFERYMPPTPVVEF
jgi:DNA-binding TFAR19-related protein (PDSD5 family)